MANKAFYIFNVNDSLELCAVIGYTSKTHYHVFLRSKTNPDKTYGIINEDLKGSEVNMLTDSIKAMVVKSDDKAVEFLTLVAQEIIKQRV